MNKLKLNCDLGEGFGQWKMGNDAAIMPFIDQANIACGFHASDPLIMKNTVKLAKQHNVTIGAHPSYPDLVGFGRRTIKCDSDELIALLQYQIGALQAICLSEGTQVSYVKPHGALYNDMMKDNDIFELVCHAIAQLKMNLKLMVQALPDQSKQQQIASQYQITLIFEGFADRNYQENGLLVPRSNQSAMLTPESAISDRCQRLLTDQGLLDINGDPLILKIESLCVHGDNEAAVSLVKTLNALIKAS